MDSGATNNNNLSWFDGYVSREVQQWSSTGDRLMTPTLAGKLSGNPVLAMLDLPDQTFNYVAPGDAGEEEVRQVTYNEAQQLQAAEEMLVLAKLILFDSEEEASLDKEYRTGLGLGEVREAAGYAAEFLEEFLLG